MDSCFMLFQAVLSFLFQASSSLLVPRAHLGCRLSREALGPLGEQEAAQRPVRFLSSERLGKRYNAVILQAEESAFYSSAAVVVVSGAT